MTKKIGGLFAIIVITLCSIFADFSEAKAAEKQPMPSAVFDASNLTLSQLRVGMAFSFDGGSNWSLIQDSWMNTITLTQDEANNSLAHGILVKMTGDGNNTYDSDVLCIVLNKANTPSNVQGVSPTDNGNSGKITNVNNSMQYKKESDSNWSDIGDTTISNLAPGKYNVRVKGSGTTIASDSITVTINGYDPTRGLPRMATPGASFDAGTMTLSGVQGINYSLNGGNNWIMAGADQVVLNLSDLRTDQGIKLYRPGNNTTNSDSEVQTINLAKASPPTGIGAVSATANAQGTINGLSPQMEYMPQGGAAWNNINTYSIQVPAGTYFIRTRGAYTTLPSDAMEVIVDVAAAPVENVTSNVTKEDDEINDIDNSVATEAVQEAAAPVDFVPSSATGPSILGNSSIRGWDAIAANMTSEPMFLNMNGTTDVTSTALSAAKTNHSELVLGMDNGTIWTIQGSSVSDPSRDVDMAVILNADAIPADTLQSLETEAPDYHQFLLAHEGDFGFAANLSMYIDTKDAGKYANLFYYNTGTNAMEHIDTCMIDSQGNASFMLNHASAYAITVNRVKYTGGTTAAKVQSSAIREPRHTNAANNESPLKWVLIFAAIVVGSMIAIAVIAKSGGKKKKRK